MVSELKRIMKIRDHNKREIELVHFCKRRGVPTYGTANEETGRREEHILIERLHQAYTTETVRRNWVLALVSSITAVVSSATALTVVLAM